MLKIKGYICLGACLLAGLYSAQSRAVGAEVTARTDQLIIQLDAGAGRAAQSAGDGQGDALDIRLPDGRSVTVLREFDGSSLVVKLPESISLEESRQIAAQMSRQAGVAAVYADKRYRPALIPNDPFYSDPNPANPEQWNLFDPVSGIRMEAAWDQQTGSNAIVVAVIDTGIIAHGDMAAARQINGYDFFSDPLLDNDGTPGRDSDATDPGDATVDNECGVGVPGEDSSWHGLLVSSVIGATTNNSRDIAGIDFAARLLHIRALGKCGGNLSDVADAIRWAAGLPVTGAPNNTNPADVINLSLSGSGPCSQPEQDAINAAVAAGSVVVAAGGNEGTNVADISPANCSNVISVGAIARNGNLASYTNVGLAIDLTAPGGERPSPDGIVVLSNLGTTTAAADAVAETQGTSFTSAQASAVASLMLAVNGTLTPDVLEGVMKATARAFPDNTCNQSLCGTGLLDATAALQGALDPSAVVANQAPTADPGGPYSGVESVAIQFDGTASSDPENGTLTYSWDFGDNNFALGPMPTHSYALPGTYTATLVVNDGLEDSSPATTVVTVNASGLTANTSNGGGGCTVVEHGRFDPLWPLILAAAGLFTLRQRKSR